MHLRTYCLAVLACLLTPLECLNTHATAQASVLLVEPYGGPSEAQQALIQPPHTSVLNAASSPIRKNNGLTDIVEWDSYSLFIKGQRVFLWSGEFHTWRLPVPSLWIDILQKIKASGMNALSVYVHWGLVNPSPGVFDFESYRSLQPLFDAALECGLWVVLRPGPYINAETTAGGIAHWATSQVAGHLRTNSSSYTAAYTPYIRAVNAIAKSAQITHGGPIIAVQIDNEYLQGGTGGYAGKAEMMREIEELMKADGIDVPLTFNDAYQGANYVNGTGSVDIYGLDSYPQRFDCANPDVWKPLVTNYHDYHLRVNRVSHVLYSAWDASKAHSYSMLVAHQPFYTPEFQAGSFDAWGPSAPGYAACAKLTDGAFESVFYKNLWAANFKMINLYMMYGGTSWGHLPYPGVYTSYDYGAAISESRRIDESDKYAELKRQGMFLRSVPEFAMTDVVRNFTTSFSDGQGQNGVAATSKTKEGHVFVTQLRNPETGAGFWISRQLNPSSLASTRFSLRVETSRGMLEIPQTSDAISLDGRESKVIVTELTFGRSSKLLYTTAPILWAGRLGDRDALILYGNSRQQHEASIQLHSPRPPFLSSHDPIVHINEADEAGYSLVTLLPGVEGLVTVWDTNEQIVMFADEQTAGDFWFPTIPSQTAGLFPNFWQFGTNDTVLVGGPHLVRSAKLSQSGTILEFRGDLKEDVTRLILVGIPKSVRALKWNGVPIEADLHLHFDSGSVFQGVLSSRIPGAMIDGKQGPFDPPALQGWKYADSLPEVSLEGYNDRKDGWILADHNKTNIPYKPYGNGSVLYGCDYGYCEGIVLWRGHFNATGSEEDVTLVVNGGAAFIASIWLNDEFLGTLYGNSSNNRNVISEVNKTFAFPHGSVHEREENVITVVQDNMGLEETGDESDDQWDSDSSKSPRGIRYYALKNGEFSSWRVQGKLGGYTDYPDKTRGIFNEGGSFGERKGWHLPGFNTSTWESREISLGLPDSKPGLGFFVTTFNLNIPNGYDVPMSFVFDNIEQPYRAMLFVNGWMMGKRAANFGPQYRFPVHEGILNYQGENTVAVLLWATESIPIAPSLELAFDAIYDGGIGSVLTNNPAWTSR